MARKSGVKPHPVFPVEHPTTVSGLITIGSIRLSTDEHGHLVMSDMGTGESATLKPAETQMVAEWLKVLFEEIF